MVVPVQSAVCRCQSTQYCNGAVLLTSMTTHEASDAKAARTFPYEKGIAHSGGTQH